MAAAGRGGHYRGAAAISSFGTARGLTSSAASKKPKKKKAQRMIYHHGSLPISAAFTLRYGVLLMRGRAASGGPPCTLAKRAAGRIGNWGEWRLDNQIRR